MRWFKILLLLAVSSLLVVFTCTTKDGKILGFTSRTGNLMVSSVNFFGARIFLDYRDTGQVTPALLQNVPVGEHVVHVFLSKTRSNPDSAVVTVEEGKESSVQFELVKVASGDISITTQPDSARVTINKLQFGITPLQVTGLPEGNYRITLAKSNYAPVHKEVNLQSNQVVEVNESLTRVKVALLEHFSNVSCPPCPQSDAIIEDLTRSYGAVLLIPVEYHPFFPSNTDPMYRAAEEENRARYNYYQPKNIPMAYVNGIKVNDPLSEESYREKIRAALQESAAAEISFSALEISDSLISGTVKVHALEDLPSGTLLMVVLVEDAVDYETPPGTNGQTHFEYVMRDMFPDANGTPIALNADAHQSVNFQFIPSSAWGQDLTVVAFLQVAESKAVLQAAWTKYPEF